MSMFRLLLLLPLLPLLLALHSLHLPRNCLRPARAPRPRRIAVLEGHSGYSFADSPLGRLGLLHGEAARHHDWHHKVPTKNFGSIMWDELCGTIDPRSQRQH